MSYKLHCYKSKLGRPDIDEAKDAIENYEPITVTEKEEIVRIATQLLCTESA